MDPEIGTWKLNEAKSKFTPGTGKNNTVVFEGVKGKDVKVTQDGTDKDGNPTHSEWTGRFDGKDYPVTGDPRSDMRSYQRVADNTLEVTVKKNGAVTLTAQGVVSADGTSRTVTSTPAAKTFINVGVFDKQ